MEIVKEVADELNESANGVRMILTRATHADGTSVYVKKEAAKASSKAASGNKPASTRVSKEDAHAQLSAAIEAAGGTVDMEIVTKLTGKAAIYLASVIRPAE